jgi:hypothetical protein
LELCRAEGHNGLLLSGINVSASGFLLCVAWGQFALTIGITGLWFYSRHNSTFLLRLT